MRYLVLAAVALLTASCVEISYKEPQPKGKKSLVKVPKSLLGRYHLSENGVMLDDVIVIFENGYRLEPKDSLEKVEEFILSDSLVLKQYKGYFFVNNRATYNWHMRVLKRKKNGELALLEMDNVPEDEESRKQFIDRLQAEIPVIQTELNGSKQYVIDPTPAKLIDLIRKGFFKEKMVLVKSN
ncbi:MAG: hypothetical protein ACK4RF_02725 [Cyclobacteriaceae bacterium]